MSSRNMTEWATALLRNYGQVPAQHHRFLMKELDALSRGEVDRLMIQMPPGSAKSTYASMLLPAWWFARHPRDSIIAASHTASLATYFGRRARSIIAEEAATLGYSIADRGRGGCHWSVSSGGEYYAVGVRGGIIGRRADVAIIDDPIKSQAEVNSVIHRERLWDWYRSELIPRLKPGAKIALVMTRWHQDDLCGRLLAQSPDEWRCLRLPALAESGDQLNRQIGSPLWPEWENTEALSRRRASVGERTWAAQFQQTPVPNMGALFRIDQITITDAATSAIGSHAVRAWDLAATIDADGNNPDWTVGVKLSRSETGEFTVVDVVRIRSGPGEVESIIEATARTDGKSIPIGLPQDPGQAGKSQISYLTRQLAGYHVRSSVESGPKITRAMPVASQVGAGNFRLLRGAWNHTFLDELRDFPYGGKDDQVDALSRAFGLLIELRLPARASHVAYLGR